MHKFGTNGKDKSPVQLANPGSRANGHCVYVSVTRDAIYLLDITVVHTDPHSSLGMIQEH